MSNPIDYQVPDELTLGYIAWYTITKPEITHEELSGLVADLGLDQGIVPPEPRIADAFKRACRYSERKGLDLPGSENKGNFLIRAVAQTPTEIERHMVLEVVDPEGRTLTYQTVVEFKFVRSTNVLKVSRTRVGEYDPLVEDSLNMFMENFKQATVFIDAQLIRRTIRCQLDAMLAFPVRRQGSVYFIPQKEKTKTLALELLCTKLGPGSAFHSLPLVDTTKQREMVHAAFEDELHEESTQLISEMKRVKGELTPRAWAAYREKLRHIRDKYNEYAGLVETEITQASFELDVIERKLLALPVKRQK